MEFPVAIHKDEGSVYGVSIPDVVGCHSYGDTIEDALRNARDAILGHLEAMLELGQEINLKTSSIESLAEMELYAGAIWALVDVDLSRLDSKPERINISLPRFVLRKIDSFVEQRHETRSGFLARVALEAIAQKGGV